LAGTDPVYACGWLGMNREDGASGSLIGCRLTAAEAAGRDVAVINKRSGNGW